MKTGGQNIKPVEDLKKAGTYRKDRHENRAEAAVKLLETIPEAPKYFDKRHRQVWKSCCEEVFALGILANPDVYLIETFVVHWIIWQDAAAEVAKFGITIEVNERTVKNPAINVMNEAARIVNQIAALFGFSPRARMGIKTEPKKPEDPLDAFNEN